MNKKILTSELLSHLYETDRYSDSHYQLLDRYVQQATVDLRVELETRFGRKIAACDADHVERITSYEELVSALTAIVGLNIETDQWFVRGTDEQKLRVLDALRVILNKK